MPRFAEGEFEDFEEYWDRMVPATTLQWHDRTAGRTHSSIMINGWNQSNAWAKHTSSNGWKGIKKKEASHEGTTTSDRKEGSWKPSGAWDKYTYKGKWSDTKDSNMVEGTDTSTITIRDWTRNSAWSKYLTKDGWQGTTKEVDTLFGTDKFHLGNDEWKRSSVWDKHAFKQGWTRIKKAEDGIDGKDPIHLKNGEWNRNSAWDKYESKEGWTGTKQKDSRYKTRQGDKGLQSKGHRKVNDKMTKTYGQEGDMKEGKTAHHHPVDSQSQKLERLYNETVFTYTQPNPQTIWVYKEKRLKN